MAINIAGLSNDQMFEMFEEHLKTMKPMKRDEIPPNLSLGCRGRGEPGVIGLEMPTNDTVGFNTDPIFSAAMWLSKEHPEYHWMFYATYDLVNEGGVYPKWEVSLECLEPEPKEGVFFDVSGVPEDATIDELLAGKFTPSNVERVVVTPDPNYKRMHVQMEFTREWYHEKYNEITEAWQLMLARGQFDPDTLHASQNPIEAIAQGIIDEFQEWFSCSPEELEEMNADPKPKKKKKRRPTDDSD